MNLRVLRALRIIVLSAYAIPAFAGNWQAAGPFGGSVQVVAVDPRHANVLLAGARNGLLFRSEDGAKSWHRISFGRTLAGTVQVLSIGYADSGDPAHARYYWAGISGDDSASAGLWESRDPDIGGNDAGPQWRQIPELAGLAVESLAIAPGDSATAVVGTRRGIYRTTDRGKSWARISPSGNPELQDITALAFDPGDTKTLYAGTPHLAWKTTDAGATWHPVHQGMIDDSDVFSISLDPGHPQRVLASACSGIYRSEDQGNSWKLLDGIPGTSRRTHIIVQDPHLPAVIYAGTTAGLFKSWNGGARWNRLNSLQVNSIAFDPADSQTLYLATEYGGITVTRDGGQTLIPMNQGLQTRNIASVTTVGDRMYASSVYGGLEGGLFAYTQQGREWQPLTTSKEFSGANVRSLTTAGQVLFAATADRIFQFSMGKVWSALPPFGLRGVHPDIRAVHVTDDGTLLAATTTGLFRRSKDGTWKEIPLGGRAGRSILSIHGSPLPVAGSTNHGFVEKLAIRTDSALFVSQDQGVSWSELILPTRNGSVNDIALSCTGGMIAATTSGLARFLSNDTSNMKAAADAPSSGKMPEGTVSAIAFHPTRCQEVYAASFGILYVSRDGGITWSILRGKGLEYTSIEKLWFTPSAPDRLFAIAAGQGIFSMELERP